MRYSQKFQLTLGKDDDPAERDSDGGLAVMETRPKLRRPSLYKVIMLNDDYTPMEFVVEILERFFAMSREKATNTMLAVHYQGRAVCGVYTRDVAETKAAQVNHYARENEHPLMCEVEAVEDEER